MQCQSLRRLRLKVGCEAEGVAMLVVQGMSARQLMGLLAQCWKAALP